jgi:hypothetical protein
MSITDYFSITVIIGGVATILGWWLKSRLDSAIKHEYNQMLELFKTELGRSNVLHSERLAAFKVLAERLLTLRRYCNARSAEFRNESEFEARTDSLKPEENMSLLQHHEAVQRSLEERELFISPQSRHRFNELLSQMSRGFNLELWLLSGTEIENDQLNANELYDLIAARVNDVLDSLYADLGFPENITPQWSTKK